MTENQNNDNGKTPEINYHAPVVDFDNEKVIVTNIGFTAKTLEKFQIVWPIPETDADAKDRYDCNISDLVAAGVRQLSTRPNYKDVGFYNKGETVDGEKLTEDHPLVGTLKPNGHEAMQELADGYQVGARQVGVSQKATVQKVKKAEGELGMSFDDMVAKMAQLKEQGLLDD